MLSSFVNSCLNLLRQYYVYSFLLALLCAIAAFIFLFLSFKDPKDSKDSKDPPKNKIYSLLMFVFTVITAFMGMAGVGWEKNDFDTEEKNFKSNIEGSSIIESSSSNSTSDILSVDSESNDVGEEKNESLENNDSMDDAKDANVEYGSPFVTVMPQNKITNASLKPWDKENDRDIFGNTYETAMKLHVYNLVDMVGGGSSNITADVHMPLGGKFDGACTVNFVVAHEMIGNNSSANITIKADENEIFPMFSINSTSTDRTEYYIDLRDVWDLNFHFECSAVDSGLCIGIVLKDAPLES